MTRLGTPNIFDFGLIFEEIFVLENGLPGVVYFRELMLLVSFTTESRDSPSCSLRKVVKNISFFSAKASLIFENLLRAK